MNCRTNLHGILASQPYIGLGYAAIIKKLNVIAEHCHALLMKESTKNLIQTHSKTRHALPYKKKTNREPPKKEREAGKGQEKKNLKRAVRCRHYRS
jgi:hypothetical protein